MYISVIPTLQRSGNSSSGINTFKLGTAYFEMDHLLVIFRLHLENSITG